MICSDYFLSNKVVEIKLSDITEVKGGIFSGHPSRPIYLFDEKRNIKLGINQHIKDSNKLVTTILQNINQNLYNELLDGMKDQVKPPERIIKKRKKK